MIGIKAPKRRVNEIGQQKLKLMLRNVRKSGVCYSYLEYRPAAMRLLPSKNEWFFTTK